MGDIVHKWGGSDGIIDRKEFSGEVRALGIEASPRGIHELFASLDADGGGSIDHDEMKDGLKR